jgi:hypothetical protein
VQAGDELAVVAEHFEHLGAHAGHDVHVDDDVGESVISTPILAMGEPMGPMEKGMTYMVRPFMQPL